MKTCLAIPSSKVPVGVLREGVVDLLTWGKNCSLSESIVTLDRPECETNPDFRQIIPYGFVHHDTDVLAYRRSSKHTESRLADKWSIGFGGHMEPEDFKSDEPLGTPYSWYGKLLNCLKREVFEELSLSEHEFESTYLGKIALDDSMVNKVHVGLVFEIRPVGLTKNEIEDRITSDEVAEVEWLDWRAMKDLVHDQFDWESWSKQVISVIF